MKPQWCEYREILNFALNVFMESEISIALGSKLQTNSFVDKWILGGSMAIAWYY